MNLHELVPLILSVWRIGLHFSVSRLKRQPLVWLVWSMNDVAWVVYALWSKQPGFILGSVVIGVIHIRAWFVWTAHERAAAKLRAQPDPGNYDFETDFAGAAS